MINRADESRPVPSLATAPTMELLTYSWRYVLGRLSLFAGISGLLTIATVATYIAGRIAIHTFGFHTASRLLNTQDRLAAATVHTMLSAFIVIPIFAGFYGIVFRLFDGDIEPIKGFAVLQKRYLSVVAASLLVGIPSLAIQYVVWIVLPGSKGGLLADAVALVIAAMAVLAVPAVVRFDLNPLDAIGYSFQRFAASPLAFLGYYLGALVLGLSGLMACGIGIICTLGVLVVASSLLLLEPRRER